MLAMDMNLPDQLVVVVAVPLASCTPPLPLLRPATAIPPPPSPRGRASSCRLAAQAPLPLNGPSGSALTENQIVGGVKQEGTFPFSPQMRSVVALAAGVPSGLPTYPGSDCRRQDRANCPRSSCRS